MPLARDAQFYLYGMCCYAHASPFKHKVYLGWTPQNGIGPIETEEKYARRASAIEAELWRLVKRRFAACKHCQYQTTSIRARAHERTHTSARYMLRLT